ncbi:MAG: hypothetical protein U0361_23075 [Nitrospiraceae bacterium]
MAAAIESMPGVKNVHDLHIWAVEPRLVKMTTHIQVDDDASLTNDLLNAIRAKVSTEFRIKHLFTIQLETQCCHPDAVHCDLNRRTAQARDAELITATTRGTWLRETSAGRHGTKRIANSWT